MKQLLIKLLKFSILFFFFLFLTKLLLPNKKNYNSAFVDKLMLLRKFKSQKKIVLIGGSSLGWSVSAKVIEELTKIKTINLGHHAAFGLKDYENFVVSCLRKDDIIVFSPEWDFYSNPYASNEAALDDLKTNLDYLYLTNRSFSEIIKYTFIKKLGLKNNDIKGDPYIYKCINANGDVVSHCNLKRRGPIRYKINFSSFNKEKFFNAYKYLFANKFILLFPPTQKVVYEKYKTEFIKLESYLMLNNNSYLEPILENVYSDSAFFDKQYHLTCEMKYNRSLKIIKILRINKLIE